MTILGNSIQYMMENTQHAKHTSTQIKKTRNECIIYHKAMLDRFNELSNPIEPDSHNPTAGGQKSFDPAGVSFSASGPFSKQGTIRSSAASCMPP